MLRCVHEMNLLECGHFEERGNARKILEQIIGVEVVRVCADW